MKTLNHTSPSPRKNILKLLLREDQTPKKLANKTDLSVSTIRTHLKTLQDKNRVTHYFKRAKRGRPKKVYKITDEGRKTFPGNYSLILSNLLRKIESKLKEETLQEVLEDTATLIVDVDEELLEKDIETRLNETVDFYDELNLYPFLTEENGYYLLELGNCGCLKVENDVHEHTCHICTQTISNFLPNSEIKQIKCLQKDDDSCVHKIKPNKDN